MTRTAPLHLRVPAAILDIALLAVVVDVGETLTASWGHLVALVSAHLYLWLLHAHNGQTLGKRLMRIKVVSTESGRPPSSQAAAIRSGVFLATLLIPVFGWFVGLVNVIYLLWSRKRLCYHDRLADTAVVRCREAARNPAGIPP
ncbi:RDD family protein [Planomonospora sp. ID67723]|uniref:RDD family protein n=1 Tax=Planomonospora sp. ID67723 TaxID=2738134 RepID=UPI0018C37085|nr:RDD family protein [Planomonospora sp. ID67723]MBG0827096.1 RDD family protein [Planomonospora sp. ID67723]